MKNGICKPAKTMIKYAIRGVGVILGAAVIGWVDARSARPVCHRYVYGVTNPPKTERNYCAFATHSDAVKAIVNSDMYTTNKESAIRVIPFDASSDFYNAIMNIAEADDVFSSTKARMICEMCEAYHKEDEA